MIEVVAALALAPWAQLLRFRPLPGWRTGANGTFVSSYGPGPGGASPKESTAWMVRGTRYRDRPTADPPDATLSQLPRHVIVVFAVVYQSARNTETRIVLRFDRARRYPCCDGTYVAGGEYALAGAGPAAAYSVNVRIYFGSPPTRSMRALAQRALNHLELPSPR
jgi:hypothetical protein